MKLKDIKRVFALRRKVWKLHEGIISSNFSTYIKELKKTVRKMQSVEGYWEVSKWVLPSTTGRISG